MAEKNNGWYETHFFNKETVREREDSETGFSAETFESIFIHRNKDDLIKTIDFLIEDVDEAIRLKRGIPSSMRALAARYKTGESEEECRRYDQKTEEGIAKLEEQIENLEAWKKYWAFYKPENDRWKYRGKNGKIYDLILTRHFNPVEIKVHSTMSHVDHEIKAEVLPDFHFKVNASAFDYFVEQIRKENSKDTPCSIFRVEPSFEIVVPSLVTIALGNYPWDNHKEQMWEWTRERQEARSELAKHPNFKLDGMIPPE